MPKIIDDTKLDYGDVLIVPKFSDVNSRSDVDLTVPYLGTKLIPLIASNMDNVGTFEMAQALATKNVMTCLVKHYKLEEFIDFYRNADANLLNHVVYSMGANEDDLLKFERLKALVPQFSLRSVCVDVANAYTESFLAFIDVFKESNPEVILHAGNVVTPEITQRLIRSGVEYVKIGVGPGSVCTTRKVTGIGYPQLSAVLECSAAADEVGGKVIADGGCATPGDIAKAFVAGADIVMLGGMLAGHIEGYKDIYDAHVKYGNTQLAKTHSVKFYGMASKKAQQNHGGVKDYRSSEGKEVTLTIRGRIADTVDEITAGLRSSCAYVGAKNISEMPRASFIKVNRQLNTVFGQ